MKIDDKDRMTIEKRCAVTGAKEGGQQAWKSRSCEKGLQGSNEHDEKYWEFCSPCLGKREGREYAEVLDSTAC